MVLHFIIALTLLLSCTLFTWLYHANPWEFINRTIFSPFISASLLSLHRLFSFLRGLVAGQSLNPQPRGPGYPLLSGLSPSTCPAKVALAMYFTSTIFPNIAVWHFSAPYSLGPRAAARLASPLVRPWSHISLLHKSSRSGAAFRHTLVCIMVLLYVIIRLFLMSISCCL